MAPRPLSPKSVLRRLDSARAAVSKNPTPRAVHRFRVEAERLRVWLQMGGHHALQRALRRLRKRASTVRTLDVQLARGGHLAHRRRLKARRRVERELLVRRLSTPRTEKLFRALAAVPAVSDAEAIDLTRVLARKVLRWPIDWKKPASRHGLRRRLRRLRYALEWQGRPVRHLVPLQDLLGDLNDLAELSAAERSTREREVKALARQARPLWEALQPPLESLRLALKGSRSCSTTAAASSSTTPTGPPSRVLRA